MGGGGAADGTGHGKVHFFFASLPREVRARLRLDDEALYSVTESRSAERMSRELLELAGVSRASSITDITSCVGGNVLSFAQHFARVTAIEIDSTRFGMLVHNVRDVVGTTNVEFIHGNAVELLRDPARAPRQDIVFMDPPWGGPDYKDQAALPLFLGDVNVGALTDEILRSGAAQVVALKVPVNFAIDDFRRALGDSCDVRVLTQGLRKMHLVLVKPRQQQPPAVHMRDASESLKGPGEEGGGAAGCPSAHGVHVSQTVEGGGGEEEGSEL